MYTGFVQRGLPRSSPKNAAAPLYQLPAASSRSQQAECQRLTSSARPPNTSGVPLPETRSDAHTFTISVSPLPASGPSPHARCARRKCGGDDNATQLGGATRLLPGEAPAAGSAPSSTPELADYDKPSAEETYLRRGRWGTFRSRGRRRDVAGCIASASDRAERASQEPHAAETLRKLVQSYSIIS